MKEEKKQNVMEWKHFPSQFSYSPKLLCVSRAYV